MGTVVGSWRLRLIIILIIYIIASYTVVGLFGNLKGINKKTGYIDYNMADTNVTENDTTGGLTIGNSITDVLGGIFNFITFGDIDNLWVRIMFNMVNAIILITLAYIIFTFVKEFIPFV